MVKLADKRNQKWAEQKFNSYVLSKNKKRIIVVEEDNKLIGCAGIKGGDLSENVKPELNSKYLLLMWIALIPEFRNKGFGSKLLTFCEKYIIKWGKIGIWTGCRKKVIL